MEREGLHKLCIDITFPTILRYKKLQYHRYIYTKDDSETEAICIYILKTPIF